MEDDAAQKKGVWRCHGAPLKRLNAFNAELCHLLREDLEREIMKRDLDVLKPSSFFILLLWYVVKISFFHCVKMTRLCMQMFQYFDSS